MAHRSAYLNWILAPALLGICAGGACFAQTPAGPKMIVHQQKAPEEAVMLGTVQVFTHAAITVEDRNNPYRIQTFSLPPSLREKYRERHLDYGDRVKVKYLLQGGQAVEVHAHWRKGS